MKNILTSFKKFNESNKTTWIPDNNEIVEYKGKLYRVISVNLGGKCVLKQVTTTRRIGKIIKDVDVSELKKVGTKE